MRAPKRAYLEEPKKMAEKPFSFITREEFERLSVDEKVDYLNRAREALEKSKERGMFRPSKPSSPTPSDDKDK